MEKKISTTGGISWVIILHLICTFGHKVIASKYRTNFTSQEHHDDTILNEIAKLTKRDILIVLGDFIFDSPKYDYYIQEFNKMPCRIKVIMGNHDSLKLYNEDRFEIQLPFYSYKNMWLSHCPIHPQEMRGKIGNIHGHLHGNIVTKSSIKSLYNGLAHETIEIPDKKYFNVNIENNDYKVIPLDTIKEYFK